MNFKFCNKIYIPVSEIWCYILSTILIWPFQGANIFIEITEILNWNYILSKPLLKHKPFNTGHSPTCISSVNGSSQMYPWSKLEDSIPCIDLETELNATGGCFYLCSIKGEIYVGHGSIYIAAFSRFSPGVSTGQV